MYWQVKGDELKFDGNSLSSDIAAVMDTGTRRRSGPVIGHPGTSLLAFPTSGGEQINSKPGVRWTCSRRCWPSRRLWRRRTTASWGVPTCWGTGSASSCWGARRRGSQPHDADDERKEYTLTQDDYIVKGVVRGEDGVPERGDGEIDVPPAPLAPRVHRGRVFPAEVL
eukprot:Sspe_Gene.849::Locus_286_Transcript_1_10_Confidence_0.522_Length_741::g.849::m.849